MDLSEPRDVPPELPERSILAGYVPEAFCKQLQSDLREILVGDTPMSPAPRGFECEPRGELGAELVNLVLGLNLGGTQELAGYGPVFRVTPHQFFAESTPFAAHVDPGWNVIIYLNSKPPLGAATGFYRHRETGVAHVGLASPDSEPHAHTLLRQCISDWDDPAAWDEIYRVSSAPGKIVAFDGLCFHSHAPTGAWRNDKSLRMSANTMVRMAHPSPTRGALLDLINSVYSE